MRSHRSLDSLDRYCIIWSRKDLVQLDAEFVPQCNDWYCQSEGATIQFLRSHRKEPVILEGRLAVGSNSEPPEVARAVEQRYRQLRTFVQKRYRNRMLRWRNPCFSENPAAVGRSSNPARPGVGGWATGAIFGLLVALMVAVSRWLWAGLTRVSLMRFRRGCPESRSWAGGNEAGLLSGFGGWVLDPTTASPVSASCTLVCYHRLTQTEASRAHL
jgi:hypothetical protein